MRLERSVFVFARYLPAILSTVLAGGLTGNLQAGQKDVTPQEVVLKVQADEVLARVNQEQSVLRNDQIEVTLLTPADGIRIGRIRSVRTGAEFSLVDSLPLALVVNGEGEGGKLVVFRPAGMARVEALTSNPNAVRRAERECGKAIVLPLMIPEFDIRGDLRMELREKSHYARVFISLSPASRVPLPADLLWWELPQEKVTPAGIVDGSPLLGGEFFLFCEHPMAQSLDHHGRLRQVTPLFSLPEEVPALNRSAAIGILTAGQKRRGFQAYVEMERPRPYAVFVNYNSWWDIAWGDRKMNEAQCLDVIRLFGEELIRKRKGTIDAFVFDDGWDDNRTLWQFHSGFPNGFTPLRELARGYDSGIGTWLSPFGGYGQARKERLAYGEKEGFEINDRGFSLAGPRYYARFRDVCMRMLKEYDIRYFKFDGIAEGSEVKGASRRFGPDIEALLYLAQQLRAEKPSVFLSMTTGTWPSPAWLFFGDSVWRGGHDWAAHGEGPVRQQWITYRDMEVYRRIVRRAPLYPLNSLMTVTVCFGQLGTALRMGREPEDLIDEIWMAASSGTQNFELYLTPGLMTETTWNALADALHWVRENQPVLVDVHWYGGDPGLGEVYGYAAWTAQKGILALRNPAGRPQEFSLRLDQAWELPPDRVNEPWQIHVRYCSRPVELPTVCRGDQPVKLSLPPFTVVVIEGHPPAKHEE